MKNNLSFYFKQTQRQKYAISQPVHFSETALRVGMAVTQSQNAKANVRALKIPVYCVFLTGTASRIVYIGIPYRRRRWKVAFVCEGRRGECTLAKPKHWCLRVRDFVSQTERGKIVHTTHTLTHTWFLCFCRRDSRLSVKWKWICERPSIQEN